MKLIKVGGSCQGVTAPARRDDGSHRAARGPAWIGGADPASLGGRGFLPIAAVANPTEVGFSHQDERRRWIPLGWVTARPEQRQIPLGREEVAGATRELGGNLSRGPMGR